MADRTRDIVNLREAARRCRAKAGEGPDGRSEIFLNLADEIDRMIQSLTAAKAAGPAKPMHAMAR